ncbi:alpha/beta fold hydrolase [Microbulbifer sp. EKSA005]|uniref:alpha/beta fold hydrolase n=1 Tax=Microbulbifer sp. EKSA005 TaxID=3243364 RepID=UPI0040420266
MFKHTRLVLLFVALLSNMAVGEQVNDIQSIKSNDTNLYVEVAGQDEGKPLLLFLHGGPGDVELGLVPFQVKIGKTLEDDYLVAYMHQRGAGKSPEVKEGTLTIDNNIEDVRNVVNFLRTHYKKDKLTLIGHSWGGALAALYAGNYPEELDGIVFISSFQNGKVQSKTSLDATLKWAMQENNEHAMHELKQYQENPEENHLLLGKWASRANDGIANGVDIHGFIANQKINEQFPGWQQQRGNLADKMERELQALNVNAEVDSLEIPALFMVGEKDTITTPSQVKDDFARYRGPKCLTILKDSHHLPFFDADEELGETLLQFLESGRCSKTVI